MTINSKPTNGGNGSKGAGDGGGGGGHGAPAAAAAAPASLAAGQAVQLHGVVAALKAARATPRHLASCMENASASVAAATGAPG
jgi:hypothetical protein